MIKVIAFDFADVIVEGPVSGWLKKNRSENTKADWHEYKQKAHLWDTGQMDSKAVYEFLSKLTGIDEEAIWKELYETAHLNVELVELIKRLKPSYKIAIFSNYISEQLKKLLVHHKIDKLFDEVIVSSEHGVKKPDPKFFEALVTKAGVNKDEIFFTDDNLDNIEAASTFGIKAYRFTTVGKLIEDLQKEGINV